MKKRTILGINLLWLALSILFLNISYCLPQASRSSRAGVWSEGKGPDPGDRKGEAECEGKQVAGIFVTHKPGIIREHSQLFQK